MSCSSRTEMTCEHPLVSELRIVLLGKVGVGKSASGNTILGKKNVFPSKLSLSALTAKCQKETATVCNQKVVVVDTPGLFHIDKTEDEVVEEIKRAVSLTEPGPHVFLIVLSLLGGVYTTVENQMVEIIRRTFGKKVMAYTMVLFTHEEELRGTSIDDFIQSNKSLKNLVKECDWGCQVFNNEAQSSDQVEELLLNISKKVQAMAGRCYTAAMLQEAEMALQREQARSADGGEKEAKLSCIETAIFSGMGVGSLVGYLASNGQVTSTLAAVLGGAAGAILAGVVAFVVVKTRDKKCGKKGCC